MPSRTFLAISKVILKPGGGKVKQSGEAMVFFGLNCGVGATVYERRNTGPWQQRGGYLGALVRPASSG